MRPRPLALGAAAALALAAAHALAPRPDGPPVAAPFALVAGAFRPLAANVLWLRFRERVDARAYDDALPLAALILALDPAFERAWFETAWTIGVDIPAFEDDPDAAWAWRRQGLRQLEEGARRNPRSWWLRHRLGFYVQYTIAPDRAIHERFERERGEPPEAFACRAYREAQKIDGHARYVDLAIERLGCPEAK